MVAVFLSWFQQKPSDCQSPKKNTFLFPARLAWEMVEVGQKMYSISMQGPTATKPIALEVQHARCLHSGKQT